MIHPPKSERGRSTDPETLHFVKSILPQERTTGAFAEQALISFGHKLHTSAHEGITVPELLPVLADHQSISELHFAAGWYRQHRPELPGCQRLSPEDLEWR
jgi:hypothetical protein